MTEPQNEPLASVRREKWQPAFAVYPGEVLAEALVDRDMTQADLADDWGVTQPYVNGFIMGRRRITARVALRLERTLGISARFWMHLQADWDLHEAREASRV